MTYAQRVVRYSRPRRILAVVAVREEQRNACHPEAPGGGNGIGRLGFQGNGQQGVLFMGAWSSRLAWWRLRPRARALKRHEGIAVVDETEPDHVYD